METKHYGIIILFLYVIAIALCLIFILMKHQVKQPPPITPSRTQHWKCDPINPNQCVTTNMTGNGTFTSQSDCIQSCQKSNNGYCAWTPQGGYTGQCLPNAEGSDGVQISVPCSDPNAAVECNQRKADQTMYCNGVYCKGDTNPWCVKDKSECKTYSCCKGETVANLLLPPSQIGPTCRLPPDTATCSSPDYAVTYYWCDPHDQTCKFATQANMPNVTGATVTTNPLTACMITGTDCWENVYWRKEWKINPATNINTVFCNYAVTTRGTPPSGDNWKTYQADESPCQHQPVLNSGWCFSPPTNQNDPSCHEMSPNLSLCMGSVVPVDRVFSCNMGNPKGNAICMPNAQPSETSYSVGKSCCPLGAFTQDGRGDAGGGTQCLPISPGCSCFNASSKGSKGSICANGQVEWDENCYDRCLPPCSGSDTIAGLLVKKCRSEASITATGGKDASECKNTGECMCRFPKEDHACDNTAAWTAVCPAEGSSTSACKRQGCVGCTVVDQNVSSLTCSTDDYISNNHCVRTLNPAAGDGDILVCPDGSDCQVGDSSGGGKSALMEALTNKTNLFVTYPNCRQEIEPLIAGCVTDPTKACVPLSQVVPTGMSDCITYNSMADTLSDEKINDYAVYLARNVC